ncbi:MAG: helix-turn-helix domain-containing protein [Suilimivivens sp.]
MNDKELRKTIGSRAKARRIELNLSQQYVAEKMDVNKSTIQRYESGTIDNTKRLIVEGFANVLHVSAEWLRGETEEYQSEITDNKEIIIQDTIKRILSSFPLDTGKEEDEFSKNLLLLLLREYESFNQSFLYALGKYSKGNEQMAETAGFTSGEEFNEVMFMREITHSINAFNEISDILRMYSRNPEQAEQRIENLLGEFSE